MFLRQPSPAAAAASAFKHHSYQEVIRRVSLPLLVMSCDDERP